MQVRVDTVCYGCKRCEALVANTGNIAYLLTFQLRQWDYIE